MKSKKGIVSVILSTSIFLSQFTNAFAITLIDQPISYNKYISQTVSLNTLSQDLNKDNDILVKKSFNQEEIHIFDKATNKYIHSYLVSNRTISEVQLSEFENEYNVYKKAEINALPTVQVSNVKNYDWYVDQGTTGVYADNNCGPSSTAMALKWFNKDSIITAQQARSQIKPNGEWWKTDDVANYLTSHGATVSYQTNSNEASLKSLIDKGDIAILCINSDALKFNNPPGNSRVGKYYSGGSGHFIVLTGYLIDNGKTYFEVYDPNDYSRIVANTNIPMGKGRYLESSDLLHAMKVWWDNAIDVHHPLMNNDANAQNLVDDIQTLIENKDNRISPPLRYAGQDRFETAKMISKEVGKAKLQNVILTSGNNFPDALSASVLAKKLNAPILLTNSTTQNSPEIFDFINQYLNKSGTIHIVGGTGIIGQDFETQLKQMGYVNIERIGGYTRYDTDAMIAQKLNVSKNTPVVIASGEDFPDALSISSIASNKEYPILLTEKNNLTQTIKNFIAQDQPAKVYIVGGSVIVSDDVQNQIKAIMPQSPIIRLSGNDRFDTAGEVAKTFSKTPKTIYLADGLEFPDALSGSALASQTGDPILLIDPNSATVPPAIADYLNQLRESNIQPKIKIFGGTSVVPDRLVKNVENLLGENS